MILIASEEVDAMAHICTHKTRVRQFESNINFRRMKPGSRLSHVLKHYVNLYAQARSQTHASSTQATMKFEATERRLSRKQTAGWESVSMHICICARMSWHSVPWQPWESESQAHAANSPSPALETPPFQDHARNHLADADANAAGRKPPRRSLVAQL